MQSYHKINSLFKRSEASHRMTRGDYARPEFEYLAGSKWEFTEKLDGTNIRIIVDPTSHRLVLRGKTDAANLPVKYVEDLLASLEPSTDLLVHAFPEGACLYGEGVGPGFVKGAWRYGDVPTFVLFDVWMKGYWTTRDLVESVAKQMGIRVAPVVGYGTLGDMVEWVEEGVPSAWGDFPAEGLIARPQIPLLDRFGTRVITKLKGVDFPLDSR